MKLTMKIGGREVDMSNKGEIERALRLETLRLAKESIRERLSGIRDPDTGDFPIVMVEGEDPDNLSIRVEGSEIVRALVLGELGLTAETSSDEGATEVRSPRLKAFVSHAYADLELAERLANDLMAAGIDVFLDAWDIRAGDSIPGKINEALSNVSHFIVLLTPQSTGRAWVKAEIDAGLMGRVDNKHTFIALRSNLSANELPPLLRPWLSPSIDDYDRAVPQLISDIHGISRRPLLGSAPELVTKSQSTRTRLSAAADSIVRLLVERSETGRTGDASFDPETLQQTLGLTDDDLIDAVDELSRQGFIQKLESLGAGRHGFHLLHAKATLFSEFDTLIHPWDPAADAVELAVTLVQDDQKGNVPSLAAEMGWEARRINPAITWLKRRQLIKTDSGVLGGMPWICFSLMTTAETRRFVKSHREPSSR